MIFQSIKMLCIIADESTEQKNFINLGNTFGLFNFKFD
ncbi:hypothetical protein P20429_0587 [Pseudoalteromonas sp. BSi20429]|nr:hypothetical protein P20429_0587 [Pseudoalteromonas sp. BSi20429]